MNLGIINYIKASDEEDEPDFVTAADIIVEELPVENYETYKEI